MAKPEATQMSCANERIVMIKILSAVRDRNSAQTSLSAKGNSWLPKLGIQEAQETSGAFHLLAQLPLGKWGSFSDYWLVSSIVEEGRPSLIVPELYCSCFVILEGKESSSFSEAQGRRLSWLALLEYSWASLHSQRTGILWLTKLGSHSQEEVIVVGCPTGTMWSGVKGWRLSWKMAKSGWYSITFQEKV